jgi:putative NADH-flavin reductase
MQVTILGASGQIGKAVLAEALRMGYEVKVLVRTPAKLDDLGQKVSIVQGDLTNATALDLSLDGSEAVLNLAGGVKETDQFNKFQRIAENLVDQMNKRGIRRLINISGAVSTISGEDLEFKRRVMKIFVGLFFKQMKQAQEALMPIVEEAKNISWTFVRPAMISPDLSTGRILVDDKKLPGTKIKLGDLAKFIVEQIESDQWIRRAPMLCSI